MGAKLRLWWQQIKRHRGMTMIRAKLGHLFASTRSALDLLIDLLDMVF